MKKVINKNTGTQTYQAEFLADSQIHKGVMHKNGEKIPLDKDEFEQMKERNHHHIKLVKSGEK